MMLAIDGPDHRALRKVYHNDLSRRVVDERREAIATLTREAFVAAAENPRTQALELFRTLVSRQVFDLMTYGAAPISAEDAEALREAFRWETNSLLLGKWPRFALRMPPYRKVRNRSEGFISSLVERYESEPPPGWFANTFAGRESLPELFADGDVAAAFLLPFVAGVDTVGSTLGFLFWELVRSPELTRRLRAAVDTAFVAAEGFPSITELRDVPELDGLVRESLRLHPAAFAVYRTAKSDFEFGGYRVEEGTDVLVFTSSTHTDPAYFPEPYSFDIDRYREPRNEHRKSHVLAPFGGGPHICLGAGMGEAQLLLTAALVIREFDLKLVSPTGPLKPYYDPSYSPPKNLCFRVRKRV
ncbi:MAG: cytochrome P450 [Bradymonadia bacterium]|jgi:cytochrome P450